MNQIFRLAATFCILAVALSGCYYDKENELYPDKPNCDTSGTITYSGQISKIMTGNCNTCHSASNPSGGVITDNYNDLSVIAQNGKLWSVVSWTGPIKMPQGLSQLSDCDLTKIRKWLDAGSPNN